MATAIYSVKIEHNNAIRVIHIFLGETEEEAQAALEAHANECPKFGPAYRNGRTIELSADVDELPEADEDSLEEFLAIEPAEESEEDDEQEQAEEEDE
jgi:alkanesulfonate monooxygenase SsuD/methylene tetrahydromethanopterin reductase-like flavin-dependent oxidoreductase (luciferase family)